MKSMWNDVFNFLRAEGNTQETEKATTSDGNKKMTNQLVMNELAKNFEMKLKEVSFDKIVTFPMSFTVIMNYNDFQLVKDYTPLLAEQAVETFYKIIDKNMTEESICKNLATYWNICFVPCYGDESEMNEEVIYTKPGTIQTLSSVHDTIFKKNNEEEDGEGSQFTVTVSGSSFFGDVNINKEALKNLTLVSKTHFQKSWKRTQAKTESITTSNNKPASISVAKLFAQGKEYSMQSGTHMVSGSAETRSDANIFRVNSDYVMNGHIRIQYIEKDNKFKIAAFSDTTLNGKDMPKSNPSDIRWMDLENDAIIVLAEDVEITFKTLI